MLIVGSNFCSMIAKILADQGSEKRIRALTMMPEWKFCIVFSDGLYQEPCAGTKFEGVYYAEHEIHAAYKLRNPDADPLM